jgi:formate hydrogenlyase subunit 3/multisubunit Na+/H+ antiporter MnhD subunit
MKDNTLKLAVDTVSVSLVALLAAHATHKPGDFPSPPWPPHAHIEAATVVSSMASGSPEAALSSGFGFTTVHAEGSLKFNSQLDLLLTRADGTVEHFDVT